MAIFNTVPPLKAGAGIKFDGERISTAAAPRNLLDNSDFRNPVNQRGQTTYNANGYTIDRWAILNGVLAIGDGYVAVKEAYQILELDTSKTYTVAARTGEGILCLSGTFTAGGEATQGNLTVKMTTNSGRAEVILTNSKTSDTGGAVWAALYEGEYTAENLPEYQPKGYGAELAECQRYYLHDVGKRCVGSVLSDAKVALSIPTPATFRKAPSVVVRSLDNVICRPGSPQVIPLDSVSNVEVAKNCVIVNFNTSLAAGELEFSTVCSYSTSIDLVADL